MMAIEQLPSWPPTTNQDIKDLIPSDVAVALYTPQLDAAFFLGMAVGERLARTLAAQPRRLKAQRAARTTGAKS